MKIRMARRHQNYSSMDSLGIIKKKKLGMIQEVLVWSGGGVFIYEKGVEISNKKLWGK